MARGSVDVKVGKEIFHTNQLEFSFSGIIPKNLIKRANRFKETGIERRWMDLFWLLSRPEKMNKVEVEEPEAAKLQENISILFILLCTGLVGSMLCFGLENVYLVVKVWSRMCLREINRIVNIVKMMACSKKRKIVTKSKTFRLKLMR